MFQLTHQALADRAQQYVSHCEGQHHTAIPLRSSEHSQSRVLSAWCQWVTAQSRGCFNNVELAVSEI